MVPTQLDMLLIIWWLHCTAYYKPPQTFKRSGIILSLFRSPFLSWLASPNSIHPAWHSITSSFCDLPPSCLLIKHVSHITYYHMICHCCCLVPRVYKVIYNPPWQDQREWKLEDDYMYYVIWLVTIQPQHHFC